MGKHIKNKEGGQRMKIFLSSPDLKSLGELCEEMRVAPVATLTIEDGLKGRSFDALARKAYDGFLIELGQKYGVDAKNITGVDSATGEVFLRVP